MFKDLRHIQKNSFHNKIENCLKFDHICSKHVKTVRTSLNMFKLVQNCWNMPKHVQTCMNMYVDSYSKEFKLAQACSKLFKHVQNCSIMFKLA